MKFKDIYSKRVQIINSLQYQMTEQTRRIYDKHIEPYFEDPSRLQGLVFDTTDTVHMTDLSVILPLETDIFLDTRFKEYQQPDPARKNLYQLFLHHQLQFLYDQGILLEKQSQNMDKVDQRVAKLTNYKKKGQIGYKYNIDEFLEEKVLKADK